MIDPKLAEFLQEGLGIHLGTRNEHLEPSGARAVAIKVEDDGLHVVLYVAKVAAERLIPDLQSNGQAAITFARPTDERACQVKGTFVTARAAKTSERPFVMQQWEGFLRNLEAIGIPRIGTTNWITWPAVAIRLRVTALFDQTPGASAGVPIA
jgi:Pyridoxamine 5'-phosphate oxidase